MNKVSQEQQDQNIYQQWKSNCLKNNKEIHLFQQSDISNEQFCNVKQITIQEIILLEKYNQILSKQFIIAQIKYTPISTLYNTYLFCQDIKDQKFEIIIYGTQLMQTDLFRYYSQDQYILIKEINLKQIKDMNLCCLQISNLQNIIPISKQIYYQISQNNIELINQCEELKQIGNLHFKQKQYWISYEYYTLALKSNDIINNNLKEICLNNRAMCLIELGYYVNALEDLNQCLIINNQNEKAIYRKAISLQQLNNPLEAINLLKNVQNINQYQNLNEILKKCELQLNFKNGNFNILHLAEQYFLHDQININEVFNYQNNIERRISKKSGYGIFAKKKIKQGEIIVLEKPIIVFKNEKNLKDNFKTFSFCQQAYQQCFFSKLKSEYFFSLTDGSGQYGIKLLNKDFDYQLQRFDLNLERIKKIYQKNAHALNQIDNDDTEGLWQLLAQINHSSFPNCIYYFLGEILILVASKDISINEELLVCYQSATDFQQYKQIMQDHEIPLEIEVIEEYIEWQKENNNIFKYLDDKIQNDEKINFNTIKIIQDNIQYMIKKYPFNFLRISNDICKYILDNNSNQLQNQQCFDLFYQLKIAQIEFELNDGPQSELIYDLISLVIMSIQQNNNLQGKIKNLMIKVGQIIFGQQFSTYNNQEQLLLAFAEHQG